MAEHGIAVSRPPGRAGLVLAEDLALPLDAATQTFLVVGKRGSGKSNTCVRMAEQLHAAGVPFVVIDPVDNWWGLKAAADGKADGLANVYVFGGRKADLPLEATAGALVADTLVEHRISAVLSVKHLSGRERGRFVTELARRLFQRNQAPLHVFLEEAHETAPQNPMKGEEEMLGAVTRLVKLGRSSGIGVSAITQRPASLSKNVTTQAEVLVVHRTLGPQDVAAVREWIRYHGEGDRDAMLGQLATLATGEAFVWAPDFPEGRPVGLRRVRMLPRETFDSSATPKAGEKRSEPKRLAPADVAKLRSAMKESIERAEADDPRALRAKLAAAERRIRELEQHQAPREVHVDHDVPLLTEAERAEIARVQDSFEELAGSLATAAAHVDQTLRLAFERAEQRRREAAEARRGSKSHQAARPAPLDFGHTADSKPIGRWTGTKQTERGLEVTGELNKLPPVQDRILFALYELRSIGVEEPPRIQVVFFSGYSHPNSKGFTNALGALCSAGLATYPAPGKVALTAAGVARCVAAGAPAAPLTTKDLHERIRELLAPVDWRVLNAVLDAYPSTIARENVAVAAGYGHLNSKGFTNALGRLRSLGLVDYPAPGSVVALPVLFLEGR